MPSGKPIEQDDDQARREAVDMLLNVSKFVADILNRQAKGSGCTALSPHECFVMTSMLKQAIEKVESL